jgi:hypothetical protein
VVAAGGFRLIVSNLDANKDVDVFVNPDGPLPTASSHQFAGLSAWAEIVDVYGSNFQNNCANNATTGCFYWFGVSPYTSGQHLFSIIVVPYGSTMPLTDGVPQDGMQLAGSTGYYSFSFPSNVRAREAVIVVFC